MTTFVASLVKSIRIYILLTLALGLVYPTVVTVTGQLLFPKQANGSIIFRDSVAVGSRLIAQKFETDRYFHPRPSAVDYSTLPSGGSNLAATSTALQEAYSKRLQLGASTGENLVAASGSGLDPEIDHQAALFQVSRVAKARGLDEAVIREMVEVHLKHEQLGFLGESRVNVLVLNLDLDQRTKGK